MRALKSDWIDEVRSRNDIVDIVSQYVKLKSTGRGYLGLCPFHNEKTPSFHVHSDKQFYHCFGCGEGGNVISFVMKTERLNFVEAVKFLAERVGMHLPTSDYEEGIVSEDEKKKRLLKDRLLKINAEAAEFFHFNLMSARGKDAVKYLASRGIDAKIISEFRIGLASDGWDNLKSFLLTKGYEEELLLQAGLLAESNKKTYDRFRNRVIFPILDTNAGTVGFGGRALDDSNPKYLNSPESMVFSKGKLLYGLNRLTKMRPLESIILVEGYIDVIALQRYGFENAVASLGTALTVDQARLIKRNAKRVFVAYDGDKAGIKAAQKGLEIFKSIDCDAKALCFPNSLDPDETLHIKGKNVFQDLLDNSLTLTGFKIWELYCEGEINSKAEATAFAKKACEYLKEEKDLIERDAQIRFVAEKSGLDVGLINLEVNRLLKPELEKMKTAKVETPRFNKAKNKTALIPRKRVVQANIRAERSLAALMARDNDLAIKIKSKLQEHLFAETIAGEIFQIVEDILEESKVVSPAAILSRVEDGEIHKQMVAIFDLEIGNENFDKFINDCVLELKKYRELEMRKSRQQDLVRVYNEGSLDPDAYTLHLLDIDASNRRIKKKGQGDEGKV